MRMAVARSCSQLRETARAAVAVRNLEFILSSRAERLRLRATPSLAVAGCRAAALEGGTLGATQPRIPEMVAIATCADQRNLEYIF